ncbi:hypothetical protein MTR67_042422 [Solanum verrucosum]|uniref:Uncharacterized protein n=1 Tax=Solanum verrucosum TaxID=315347 RepID=A0AAF0ZR46_SOLVR|nr:hypothetical protein MTR67_042422 [Solanum verrucosum]
MLQYCFMVQINRSSTMEFRATTLCDKMKELIYGPSCNNNMESNHFWDIAESEWLRFDALELLPTLGQNPN